VNATCAMADKGFPPRGQDLAEHPEEKWCHTVRSLLLANRNAVDVYDVARPETAWDWPLLEWAPRNLDGVGSHSTTLTWSALSLCVISPTAVCFPRGKVNGQAATTIRERRSGPTKSE
jgi:hypothetical protein